MALNRDKFRKIVGGITTPESPRSTSPGSADAAPPITTAPLSQPGHAGGEETPARVPATSDYRRFAKRGRPKGSKDDAAGKTRKVKVSLFLSEDLVNDLYDWAHADKIHPGEMFDRALKLFREQEAKRRNPARG